MLTPSYLAGLPDEMVKIYSQLEADIACDVARRVAKLGKITDIAKWQMMILDELGSLKSSINKALTKYNDQAQKELKRLFEEAVQKSAQKDLAQYNKAHLSDNQKQILEATVMKLSDGKIAKGAATTDIINNQFKADYEGLVRLTQTIASNAESRFVEECNGAYMKVASGAFDYNTAIKQSVNSLAKNDRTSVNYNYKKETRSLSIEAAVRMNVMTGINQTCAEITERNCEDLGVELVEVDAHEGARPEHAAWQGKVYVRGKAREVDGVFYDSFEEVCKPGTATGICGINCRHSYYPYFPGMEKHYDGKDLKEMNKKDVEYNGKLMTKYEARQKQRAIERKIRQWKRTADIQKAGGVDDTFSRQKMTEWQGIAKDFTEKTNLLRDFAREYIGTKNGKQPTPKQFIVTEDSAKVEKWAPNINDLSVHAIQRMKERSITFENIQEIINKPLRTTENMIDKKGNWGYKVISSNGWIAVNPLTGKIITVIPLTEKNLKNYLKRRFKDEDNKYLL